MIFTFFYDVVLLSVAVISLPYVLWKWWRYGKYRESLVERLGIRLPSRQTKSEGLVIWFHAVSMGETRAVIALYRKIKEHHPEATIYFSSTTETGHAEAKRSFPDAAAHFFLPLDLSWTIKRILKRLDPDLLILVESDFWYNLLYQTSQFDAKIALVNGKISQTSTKRYAWAQFFAQRVFSCFDLMLVQNEEYRKRFTQLRVPPDKLRITGNLKLSTAPKLLSDLDRSFLLSELGLKRDDRIVVVGSTHDSEEEWIFSALSSLWDEIPKLRIILVPRHPERFEKVSEDLKKRNINFLKYSERAQKSGAEKVLLINAMGMLNSLYQIGELAIVGGSFISHVGGHNIFEPIALDVPVLFGPHMEEQKELMGMVLSAGAGKQVTIDTLTIEVRKLLLDPVEYKKMLLAGKILKEQALGSIEKTWKCLEKILKKKKRLIAGN